jgi:uncharacterized protein YoxC
MRLAVLAAGKKIVEKINQVFDGLKAVARSIDSLWKSSARASPISHRADAPHTSQCRIGRRDAQPYRKMRLAV